MFRPMPVAGAGASLCDRSRFSFRFWFRRSASLRPRWDRRGTSGNISRSVITCAAPGRNGARSIHLTPREIPYLERRKDRRDFVSRLIRKSDRKQVRFGPYQAERRHRGLRGIFNLAEALPMGAQHKTLLTPHTSVDPKSHPLKLRPDADTGAVVVGIDKNGDGRVGAKKGGYFVQGPLDRR